MSNNKFYPDVKSSVSFPEIEEEVLKYWQENNIFTKSVESRKAKIGNQNNEFIFYDGPPFANGLPHYGHLLTGFIKDVFARYQTTKGKKVERRFGWDCHGLPIEQKVSVANPNLSPAETKIECRKYATGWINEQRNQFKKLGIFMDWENPYKTMDYSYEAETVRAFVIVTGS